MLSEDKMYISASYGSCERSKIDFSGLCMPDCTRPFGVYFNLGVSPSSIHHRYIIGPPANHYKMAFRCLANGGQLMNV